MQPDGKLSGVPTSALGYWYWSCGPEWDDTKTTSYPDGNPADAVFYNRITYLSNPTPGITVTYNYTNWHYINPSNSGSGEFCIQALGGTQDNGVWNDWPNYYSAITGYIVEYRGVMIAPNSKGLVGFGSVKNASIAGIPNNGTAVSPVPLYCNEILTYTVTAANISETNTSVIVRDTVPEGLEVIAGSITQGGVFDPITREIVWTLTIPAEEETTVGFQVRADNTASNLMNNTAYITSITSDGNVTKSTNTTHHQGISRATAADITVNGTTGICYGTNTALTASAPGVTTPVFQWYKSQAESTPFHTGASYTTSLLTVDTTFYISVKGDDACENATGDRKEVTVSLLMPSIKNSYATIFTCEETDILIFDEDYCNTTFTVINTPKYGIATPQSGGILKYGSDGGSSSLPCEQTGNRVDTVRYSILPSIETDVVVRIYNKPEMMLEDSCSVNPKIALSNSYDGFTYQWEHLPDGASDWEDVTPADNSATKLDITQAGLYRVTVYYDNGKMHRLDDGLKVTANKTVQLPGGITWYEFSSNIN
jgi:uncharacterized repeat protein (TIGR01451 family)